MTSEMDQSWVEFAPLMMACVRGWRRALNALLTEYNLSDATATPLIMLYRHGDRIPQGILAERVGVEGPTLVRVLDGLEADGLIVRVAANSDRRIKLVEMTVEGRKVAEQCEQCATVLRQEMLGGLDPAQVNAALEVLRSVSEKTGTAPVFLDVVD